MDLHTPNAHHDIRTLQFHGYRAIQSNKPVTSTPYADDGAHDRHHTNNYYRKLPQSVYVVIRQYVLHADIVGYRQCVKSRY